MLQNTYRYRCITENKNIIQNVNVTDSAPTLCKNASWHVIDPNTLTLTKKARTPADIGLQNVQNIKDNLIATTDPALTDDQTKGYAAGSKWVNINSSLLYICTNAATNNAVWIGTGSKMWIFRDEYATGTNGGTFNANLWVKRSLNTTTYSDGSEVVLDISNSRITLQSGTYSIKVTAVGNNVGDHQLRLYNHTDYSVITYGLVQHDMNNATHNAAINYIVNITTPQTFQIEHRCSITRLNDGLGYAVGVGREIYAEVVITKTN